MLFQLFFQIAFSLQGKYRNGDIVVAYFGNIGFPEKPAEAERLKRITAFRDLNINNKIRYWSTTGDKLLGIHLKDIGIHLRVNQPQQNVTIFKKILSPFDVTSFKLAVSSYYNYEIFLDDILKYYEIGRMTPGGPELATRMEFTVFLHDNCIVDFKVEMCEYQRIVTKMDLDFQYSVRYESIEKFNKTETKPRQKYFENEKSVCLNIVLTILFILYVKSLYNQMMSDFEHSTQLDLQDLTFSADRGWKILHGDVFRSPKYSSLLFMLASHGLSLVISVIGTFGYCMAKGIPRKSGTRIQLFLFSYIAGNVLCGWFAAAISFLFSQKKWLRLVFGANIIPNIIYVGIIWSVKIFADESSPFALSVPNIIGLTIFYLLPSFGACIFGSIIALKERFADITAKEIAVVPRIIPKQPWYTTSFFLCFVSAIIIGIMMIPNQFILYQYLWKGKTAVTFSDLTSCVFCIFIVSGCLSIYNTFLRLHNESYNWQWISFLAPFSSFFIIILYSVFYFYFKIENMRHDGCVVYFAFTAFFSLVCGLSCGGIGVLTSTIFIRSVFSNSKLD
ncbi:hypothetical protein TVAG_354840 [Trichomonas vaginalis G3]|uniref:Transmembrane 9 superfamily member n=1 Tax=Trichomonas vaginalis (strain ATCC PRA-98 / G3) TaxID=412133 RepID=A2EFW9_TRIV3|nr:secretion of lysosomal enzymes [Trichomonas vaginalis G3]EAY08425.1 hypothetical protein TVAG_354840 [Trichomonas vaginalis G3]KAI5518143.1 secretion of lysosomal enzymes [Trichomonas vaginalis G3]|eukprot:XP_001320648.1 hypothetical protein [Trichomonas vaginalis G3]